ncbi:MAG: fatty acyl-AMP ligase [Vicinamibacterales bacterium]
MITPPIPGVLLRLRAETDPGRVIFTYVADDAAPVQDVTYAALVTRASAIAGELVALGLRGRPVLLVYRAGPAFSEAFFGALLAGAIAVPVPVPQFGAQWDRLERVARDCDPGALLTTAALATSLESRIEPGAALRRASWLVTDGLEGSPSGDLPVVAPSDLALLQYTSGSTAEPRGVAVTHANLACNASTIVADLPVPSREPAVSWLPHFHDMGLIAGLVTPVYRDCQSVLMAPMAFLQRPLRWLETISRFRAQTSGAPNFAYGLCVRAAEGVDLQGLDLSSWDVAYVGAEPVRRSTLETFAMRFAPHGFDARALTPCYGMAEATLLVTSKRKGTHPTWHGVSRAGVEQGLALPSEDPAALPLVGCGVPVTATDVRIVDPVRRAAVPPMHVGEVWVSGPQVARGYWRPGADDPFGWHLDDAGDGPFLRTGDLAFMTVDGELVFVDRLKDLVIVNGQNHVCHDLELTAGASHALLSPDACIVCGIEAGERTVIAVIAELPVASAGQAGEVAQAIRAALLAGHSLPAHAVAFVGPRKLSRTTSGKLQRRLTAARLQAGDLRTIAWIGEALPPLDTSSHVALSP